MNLAVPSENILKAGAAFALRHISLVAIIFACTLALCSCTGRTALSPSTSNAEPVAYPDQRPTSAPAAKDDSTGSIGTPVATGADQATGSNNVAEIQALMEKMARDADNTVIDGWFFGQEARLLKSFYRKVDAAEKARFATDYHKFIVGKNQDMVANFESYVPYSARVSFARQWWAKENPRFLKQGAKYQVLWLHESIEDAGELWWRAVEKLRTTPLNSMEVLAHDEEQKMVSKFMESTRSLPGSISDQIWKATHGQGN